MTVNNDGYDDFPEFRAGYTAGRTPSLPGQCRAVASWNGETWHHCSRLADHDGFHLSQNGATTWPLTGDGDPSWRAPWPKEKP